MIQLLNFDNYYIVDTFVFAKSDLTWSSPIFKDFYDLLSTLSYSVFFYLWIDIYKVYLISHQDMMKEIFRRKKNWFIGPKWSWEIYKKTAETDLVSRVDRRVR